jgi:hypothetical protein
VTSSDEAGITVNASAATVRLKRCSGVRERHDDPHRSALAEGRGATLLVVGLNASIGAVDRTPLDPIPVSYTHQTLPTKSLV